MSKTPTISELLNISGSQYRIYDIGRKIEKISKADFEKIEDNRLPYPSPSQGHAFVAIAFWQKDSPGPYLWFVKLPLDERGLLVQASRDHFVAIIVEALGSDLSVDPSSRQEELLKSNPYHFTPSQYKLAFLNSLLKIAIKQPASEFFTSAKSYIEGKVAWDNWHNIGVQGLTDVVARVEDVPHKTIADALPHLPEQVLLPLCSALENVSLAPELIEQIIEQLQADTLATTTQSALTRALASSCQHPYVINHFSTLLTSKEIALNEELLIIIAGRCWQVLQMPALMMAFLEALVCAEEQQLFPSIFKDLVAIPQIRPILFQCMRDPSRSDALGKAIGLLFNQAN